MKVFNLRCAGGHGFEGWFGSEDDFRTQSANGLLSCPVCGEAEVQRLPAAPRLNVGAAEPKASPPARSASASGASASNAAVPSAATKKVWLRAVAEVMARTTDVGDGFADEARRMHYGETEERAIRGRATPQEARELHDEGIDIIPLPMPPDLEGPLQ